MVRRAGWVVACGAVLLVAGCIKPVSTPGGGSSVSKTTAKPVVIDGSSTVYPISQAIAVEFERSTPGIRVTVGQSGTGSGFKKFILEEIDICDASRPITEEEVASCHEKGIEWLELQVAIDGLSVVVNPQNTWCECLTIDQLKRLWEPGSKVSKWSDLDPSWPAEPVQLYGAGTDSGTFEYFTEVVVGKKKSSRTDYTPSENDNVLVTGVADNKHALGYFGSAYYEENRDRLKVIAITSADGKAQCVKPNVETILSGAYQPLARPVFVYVNIKKGLIRPEVQSLLRYYLSAHGQEFVTARKMVQMDEPTRAKMVDRLEAAITAANPAPAHPAPAATPATTQISR